MAKAEQPLLVYADTSVFGGALDAEFREQSLPFFEAVRKGKVLLFVSLVVLEELDRAPEDVRVFFSQLSEHVTETAIDESAYTLRKGYLDANVIGTRWTADALHVAVATVSGCHAIASWNFKHIVNYRRISLYNEVNRQFGFGTLAIHTPPELVTAE